MADLRRRVASLEAEVKRKPRDAWKLIIGTSKGQCLDREAAKLGAEWRARQNEVSWAWGSSSQSPSTNDGGNSGE